MVDNPPSSRELFGVQMLRGLAAIFVVFHHTLEEANGAVSGFKSPDWLTTAGASGVDVFFVISGFIMLYTSFPAGRKPIEPGRFLFRRATRIFPIYWACCLTVLVLSAAGFFKSKVVSTTIILKSLALLQLYDPLVSGSWTLSYEIYFYLIFAATLLLRSKDASTAITSIAIVTFFAIAQGLPEGEFRDFLANPIAIEFCFGLMLARVFILRQGKLLCPAILSLFGFIALLGAPLFVLHENTTGLAGFSRVVFWGLPASLIVLRFLSVGKPRGSTGRFAVHIGDASYAIYLTHFLVMVVYAWLLKRTMLGQQSQIFVIPIVVFVCIALGSATNLILERRLLGMVRTVAGGRARAVVTPASLENPRKSAAAFGTVSVAQESAVARDVPSPNQTTR